jgi:hypothetical protein
MVTEQGPAICTCPIHILLADQQTFTTYDVPGTKDANMNKMSIIFVPRGVTDDTQ